MDLQRVFWALGDPQRFRIVEVLRESPCCVSDLVERTGAAQPNVSRHLKVLREAGVISSRREGKWIRYALVPEAMEAIREWVGSGRRAAPAAGPAAGPAAEPDRQEEARPEREDESFLFTS